MCLAAGSGVGCRGRKVGAHTKPSGQGLAAAAHGCAEGGEHAGRRLLGRGGPFVPQLHSVDCRATWQPTLAGACISTLGMYAVGALMPGPKFNSAAQMPGLALSSLLTTPGSALACVGCVSRLPGQRGAQHARHQGCAEAGGDTEQQGAACGAGGFGLPGLQGCRGRAVESGLGSW